MSHPGRSMRDDVVVLQAGIKPDNCLFGVHFCKPVALAAVPPALRNRMFGKIIVQSSPIALKLTQMGELMRHALASTFFSLNKKSRIQSEFQGIGVSFAMSVIMAATESLHDLKVADFVRPQIEALEPRDRTLSSNYLD